MSIAISSAGTGGGSTGAVTWGKSVTGFVPLVVEADFSKTTDAENCLESIEIDWGDDPSGLPEFFPQSCGSPISPSSAQHTYDTQGTYTIALIVTDDMGNQSTDTATVIANGAATNSEPIADFTFATVPGQKTVTFDATLSTDPDGGTLTYSWDFGDGGKGTGATPSHNYRDFGDYDVSLTVKDPKGLTDTVSNTVSVVENPAADDLAKCTPEAVFTGDSFTCISYVKPPQGERIKEQLWEPSWPGAISKKGSTASFNFNEPGDWDIALTVTFESTDPSQVLTGSTTECYWDNDSWVCKTYPVTSVPTRTEIYYVTEKIIEPLDFNVFCDPDSGSEPMWSICGIEPNAGSLDEHEVLYLFWDLKDGKAVRAYKEAKTLTWDRVEFLATCYPFGWCPVKTVKVTEATGNIISVDTRWWKGGINLDTLEVKHYFLRGGTLNPSLQFRAQPKDALTRPKYRTFR